MSNQVQEELNRLVLSTGRGVIVNNINGEFVCASDGLKFTEFAAVLNKLRLINDGRSDMDPAKFLRDVVNMFPLCDFNELTHDNDVKFMQVLSLWVSNDKINQIIKTEMSIELIEYIADQYVTTLEVLRSLKRGSGGTPNILLVNISLVSPLLITISFSFRMNYSKSKILIKILCLVVIYHLNTEGVLFDELIKLFIINHTTNMEVFEVFNKLWVKTLENTAKHDDLNINYLPGPLSLSNRLELLNSTLMSKELIDQVIPYDSNEFLLKLSKDFIALYTSLNRLKTNSQDTRLISNCLNELLGYLSTDLGCELVQALVANLGLERVLVDLQSITDCSYKPVINYILFKISFTLEYNSSKISNLTKHVLTTDIIEVIESSDFARYKVYFEVIDHNLKTDFISDFHLLFALETALFCQMKHFDFAQHVDSLVELGSSLSIEAIQNNISFILQNALLRVINPKRILPAFFSKVIHFRKFPPLPRSDFLRFGLHDNTSKRQLGLKNLSRLLHCLQLNTDIIEKTLEGLIANQDHLGFIQGFDAKALNPKFKATDFLLKQTYVSLITNFIVVEELKRKAYGYQANKVSPMFFDYSSVGNVLKLKTFEVFEKLFVLYDSFGLYCFLKFVIDISTQDLSLQKISILLLNHLFFHSDKEMNLKLQCLVLENSLLNDLLSEYILAWNEPSSKHYKAFNNLFNFDAAIFTRMKGESSLNKTNILKDLGYNEVDHLASQTQVNKLLNIVSPASSSSSENSTANVSIASNSSNKNCPIEAKNHSSCNTTVNSIQNGQNGQANNDKYNNYCTSNSGAGSSGFRCNDKTGGYNAGTGYITPYQYGGDISRKKPFSSVNHSNTGIQTNRNSTLSSDSSARQMNARTSQPYYPSNPQSYYTNVPNTTTYDNLNIHQSDAYSTAGLNLGWTVTTSNNTNHNSFNGLLAQPQATGTSSFYDMDQYYTN